MAADLLEWADKAQPGARCERRPGPLRSLSRRDRMADATPTLVADSAAPKRCRDCGQDLPLTEFHRDKRMPDGLTVLCKRCNGNASSRYKARMAARSDAEVEAAMPAQWRCNRCRKVKPNSAFARNRTTRIGIQHTCYDCHRDARYGLAPGEYDRRMKEQDGRCAICRALNPHGYELSVDHNKRCCPDHRSCGKCVRGLLCQNCNAAIGMLGDDPVRLARAIAYVEGGGFYGF